VKPIASLLFAVAVAGQLEAQSALPVPSGRDSAAISAIFARHTKATTVPTAAAPTRFMHMKQQMEMQGAPPVEMETFLIMPIPGKSGTGKVRSVMNMPMMGMMETVVNGSIGWVAAPGQSPTLLPADQIEQAMFSANPNPLSSIPGGKMSLMPKATIDGREMVGVRIVDTLGTDAIVYFESKSGLASAVRTGSSRGMAQDTSVVMLLGDYEPFNGTLMPRTLTVRQGAMQSMTLRTVKMESTPIDTMMFVPPASVVEMLKLKKP
jgi:hypothetical protein